jgi:cytochrome c oxidase subunit IV
MAGHVVSPRIYYLIFGSLMVLTGVTVGVAFIDLRVMNTVVALTIAVVKATLVVLFFMHLKYSSRLTWVVGASALVWLAIMFGITFADYLSRGWVNAAQ